MPEVQAVALLFGALRDQLISTHIPQGWHLKEESPVAAASIHTDLM